MVKLRIKKGDTVKVIAGDDKGKTGKVIRVIPAANKVVVEGVKSVIRHKKVDSSGSGGRVSVNLPIDISNVAYYDVVEASSSKIAYRSEGSSKKRVLKSFDKIVD